MKKTLLSLIVMLSFLSCEKRIESLPQHTSNADNYRSNSIGVLREEPGNGDCVTAVETELITLPDENGIEQVRGSLIVSNDNNFLYVVVNTLNADTRIGSIQLLYGDANLMNDLNQYSDDPSVGLNNPQINVQPETVQTSYTISLPLASINTDCLLLTVHASFYTSSPTSREMEIPVWVKPVTGSTPVMRYPWSANLPYCTQFCVLPTCGQLRTQTPGGWGSTPQVNNPGTYMEANFANAFPSGLTIGCVPDFNIQLNSADAARNFLPSGGRAQVLTMNYINPVGMKNVLAGHLAALSLSVGFDDADVNFGEADISLGAMEIINGAFAGWKVDDFLTEANQVLGSCSKEHSLQQVLQTAAGINENYVDGKIDKGFLKCPQ